MLDSMKMDLQEVIEVIRALVCNSDSWVHTGSSGSFSCLNFPSCFRSARINDARKLQHLDLYLCDRCKSGFMLGCQVFLPLEPSPWPTLYSSFNSPCVYIRPPEKCSRVSATQGPKFNHICKSQLMT